MKSMDSDMNTTVGGINNSLFVDLWGTISCGFGGKGMNSEGAGTRFYVDWYHS